MLAEIVELTSCDFRAMGTHVEVFVVEGNDDDLHWARSAVAAAEARWSRFLPTSEVTAVTRAAGCWVSVSPSTVELLQRAVAAVEASGGAFDPLLGAQLAHLGYDRDFALVASSSRSLGAAPSRAPGALEVDSDRGAVRIPRGTALDLGGLAKGWTADRVAVALVERGAAGACVNIGGDLAVAGQPADPAGWSIEIDHDDQAVPRTIDLHEGGVATSTSTRRRWAGPDGRDHHHHLLDPATGEPCRGATTHVTVVAPSAADAEVLAKIAFVDPLALEAGLAAGRAAAWVTDPSGTRRVGAWASAAGTRRGGDDRA